MFKVPAAVAKGVFCLQIAAIFVALLNAGCSSSDSSKPPPEAVSPFLKPMDPVVKSIPAEAYMNGKTFCQKYQAITSLEIGRFVSVPVDYAHPERGQLQIYAYTLADFDPSKPSYIYVDGGPGQNTHGMMPQFFAGSFNEIRFDQRGLGCSAPETYGQYQDSRLYSSMNNIKDMEEIRKSYGIQKWSVYGVSYGTVPATMYGSHYPNSTSAVVLEGTFGRPDQVHVMSYKAEKINLVLATLSPIQKTAFDQFLKGDQGEQTTIFNLVMTLFYQDRGMATAAAIFQKVFLPDGTVDHAMIAKIAQYFVAKDSQYPDPQQPGAVDENIMNIIYCKNLGFLHKMNDSLDYNPQSGFYSVPSETSHYREICQKVGVQDSDEQPYVLSENKITVPVYYFQGSHDGATQALGAMTHWKTIPQGVSYFMLAEKGGHNPNLTRLGSLTADHLPSPLSQAETKLFETSIQGAPITADLIQQVNDKEDAIQKWVLFLSPTQDTGFLDELQGIQMQRLGQPVF